MKTQMHQPSEKLEKMRGIFFQIGLIVACGLTLLAFEWKFPYKIKEIKWDNSYEPEDMIIVNTYFPEKKIEKPKMVVKREQPKIIKDKLVIVKKDDNSNDNEEKERTLEEIINPFTNTNPIYEEEIDPFVDFMKVEYLPVPLDYDQPVYSYEESKMLLDKAILTHLSNHLKFPQCGRILGISGVVLIDFKIDETGKVIDVKVNKSTHKCFEKEALKMVQSLPKFKPALQNGKPVGIKMQLPIKFSYKY